MRVTSVLDGVTHEVPGQTWLHNIADAGRSCPCRPEMRRGIVIHHKNSILEAQGRETIKAAVARLDAALGRGAR